MTIVFICIGILVSFTLGIILGSSLAMALVEKHRNGFSQFCHEELDEFNTQCTAALEATQGQCADYVQEAQKEVAELYKGKENTKEGGWN